MRFAAAFCLPLLLTGCALGPSAAPTPQRGLSIRGNLHGGQQPIVGAHVYLFAANTTGYGNPSVSTLSPTAAGVATDSVGTYVTTDANGSFTTPGDYTCTAGTQLFFYALGGNPGAGTNDAAGLLAVVGQCPVSGTFATPVPFVWINEVSTVAAAYAMAGYATDATHVSSSGTPLALTGIANAFANAANLASISTGTALSTTPAGNGTVPQTEINTLANILASCINTTGAITGPTTPTTCYTLFNNAQSNGATGIIPTDTATAAINIAHNPAQTSIFTLQTGIASPFQPDLTAAPNDFTISLNLTGGGIFVPAGIAIDASGNAWSVNNNTGILSEFSSSGVPLSPSTGFPAGSVSYSQGVAIDSSGNVWGIAVDGSGNVWVTDTNGNSLTEFIGAATPVVTPLSYAVKTNSIASRP